MYLVDGGLSIYSSCTQSCYIPQINPTLSAVCDGFRTIEKQGLDDRCIS